MKDRAQVPHPFHLLGEDISNIDEEERIRLIEGGFIYPAKTGPGMRYPVDILRVKRVKGWVSGMTK